jgi:voltage-gated potassium channel
MQKISIVLATTLLYGLLYATINALDPKAFGFKRSIDPFYFSFTTISTVGYGDYGPKTDMAKMIVMSQQFLLLTEILN